MLDSKVFLVPHREFASVFVDCARRANKCINAAYLLANATIYNDTYRVGRKILKSLVLARSRYLRVSLLLGWPSDLQSKSRNFVVAKFLNSRGMNVKIHYGEDFHHKFCVFDDRVVLIGSHNLTLGALTKNFELSVAISDATVANRMLVLHRRLMEEATHFEEIEWSTLSLNNSNAEHIAQMHHSARSETSTETNLYGDNIKHAGVRE